MYARPVDGREGQRPIRSLLGRHSCIVVSEEDGTGQLPGEALVWAQPVGRRNDGHPDWKPSGRGDSGHRTGSS